MEAADLLGSRLEAEADAFQACMDLILQWVAARVCEANTAALLAVLGFTRALLLQLTSQARAAAHAHRHATSWQHQHAS